MVTSELAQAISPSPLFRKEVEVLSGVKVSACFQCEKCTNGCPVTFAMDIAPHRLIRSIQLGMKDEVLGSDTLWVCASCETCTTRCPNDVDIAHLMDTLRQMAVRRGVKESQKQVPVFHSAFLSSIKMFGRVHETTMAVTYALKSGGIPGLLKQMNLGLEMMRRGKIKLLPGRLWAGRRIRTIFRDARREKA